MKFAIGILVLCGAAFPQAKLQQHRNLGKAFYENPTTQKEAVEQFKAALDLAPGSAREILNYGLALLRAGETDSGVAQLEKAQKLDPSLPHTWFNLGIAYQKMGDYDRAFAQFTKFVELVPAEPVGHYHLGTLNKLRGNPEAATKAFEKARDLNPRLAAPHFQLYGMYRQQDRAADSAAEMRVFQTLKKQQEGAAVPEDMDWCFFAEIYDPVDPRSPARLPAPAAAPKFDLGEIPDLISVAPGDTDNDGVPELCVLTPRGAFLYRKSGEKYAKNVELDPKTYRKAIFLDFDHDYDQDLFLLGDSPKLLRNNGPAGWSDETARFPFVAGKATDAVRFDLEPDTPGFDLIVAYQDRPGVLYRDLLGGTYKAIDIKELPAGAGPLTAFDADRDSWTDLIAGKLFLANRLGKFRPEPIEPAADPGGGNWIEVVLQGVKNPKIPINAHVEVKAGDGYEKLTYQGVPLRFALGARASVDTVRITWPNGLIQNEINQPVNRTLTYKEAQRLSGSCPMIFTWNGKRFEFITDVLGVAPLGASSGDGRFFPVDHDEYVTIPGEKLVPRDGQYEIRVTEELREVSYLDHLSLIAVDHPADHDFVTNEKFKAPPFPEFRLYDIGRKIYPERSGDVLYFGTAAPDNRAVLVLNGWIDWPDGSEFLAATQAKRDLVFPYLQVRDSAGNWKTVIEDMGVPSGKPKRMAVDLTGKFLSNSREVRIVTTLPVHWNEIFLVEGNAPPQARLTPMAISFADLHFRGFSKLEYHSFDYDVVSPTSMWNPTPGNYTRYGAADDLVGAIDDRLVVMGSGDELALRFDGSRLPAVPEGWRRDFLLLVDGWAKDGDANTAFSRSVLPLPFHGMSRYPYPPNERPPERDSRLTRPALRLLRPLANPTLPPV